MSELPTFPQKQKAVLVIALDLLTQLNQETEHLPAAMTFCNELSFHFKATRVALGYEQNGQMKIVALNNTAHFETHSAEIKDFSRVMDEAWVQDADIVWPLDEDHPVLSREHERYALQHCVHTLVTLPLRLKDEPCGAVTLVREDPPFTDEEINVLRVIVDLSSRRLLDLNRYGNHWWKPYTEQFREILAWCLGPRHPFWKLAALLGASLFLLLFILSFPYRVTGMAEIRTDQLITIAAPFDGYLKSVDVGPGDTVHARQEVAALDPTELTLRQAEIGADIQHYQSQEELSDSDSSSDNATAQMHVYQSQANQAKAQLEQINYNLMHAKLFSPFDGVVVEGDLRNKIMSPLKEGDALLKVSRLQDLYLQIDIADADIAPLQVGQKGEVRLESRPGEVVPIEVTIVEPAAFAEPKGNIFRLQAKFLCPPQSWWRPGMTGLAKINTPNTTLWYSLTHKFFDYLILKLWW